MKHAAGPRREIGIRTVFNILGPLTNPAHAQSQLLGVASADLGDKLAQALGRLGVQRALVVHGDDGLDELSISGPSTVHDLCAGELRTYTVTPEDAGLERAPRAAVRGGTAVENAATMRELLKGADSPVRDFVLLNAGASLVVGGKAGTLGEGARLAAQVIDSGAALAALDRFVSVSNAVAV
jgi:anthranilate phosphoribosyltransferase